MEMFWLTSLEIVEFSYGGLKGTIPTYFKWLTKLQRLTLESTDMIGTVRNIQRMRIVWIVARSLTAAFFASFSFRQNWVCFTI